MITIKKTSELVPGDRIAFLGDTVKIESIVRMRRYTQVTLSYYSKNKGRVVVWHTRLSNKLDWSVTNESS